MNEHLEALQATEERRPMDIAAMNLSGYGEFAIDPLLELLVESGPETNLFIVRTLGEIGDDRVCPEIFNAYEENHLQFGYEVIMALGRLRCSQFEDALLAEILSPGSKVKSYAAWVLGQIRSVTAVTAWRRWVISGIPGRCP